MESPDEDASGHRVDVGQINMSSALIPSPHPLSDDNDETYKVGMLEIRIDRSKGYTEAGRRMKAASGGMDFDELNTENYSQITPKMEPTPHEIRSRTSTSKSIGLLGLGPAVMGPSMEGSKTHAGSTVEPFDGVILKYMHQLKTEAANNNISFGKHHRMNFLDSMEDLNPTTEEIAENLRKHSTMMMNELKRLLAEINTILDFSCYMRQLELVVKEDCDPDGGIQKFTPITYHMMSKMMDKLDNSMNKIAHDMTFPEPGDSTESEYSTES